MGQYTLLQVSDCVCVQAWHLGEFQRMVELQESACILQDLAHPRTADNLHSDLRVRLDVSADRCYIPASSGHCAVQGSCSAITWPVGSLI